MVCSTPPSGANVGHELREMFKIYVSYTVGKGHCGHALEKISVDHYLWQDFTMTHSNHMVFLGKK